MNEFVEVNISEAYIVPGNFVFVALSLRQCPRTGCQIVVDVTRDKIAKDHREMWWLIFSKA